MFNSVSPSTAFKRVTLTCTIDCRLLYLLFLFLFLLADSTLYGATWRAGFAKHVITPAEPTWMAGYASRNRPAEGKIGELYAKAMVLEDVNKQRFVLVTLDLISVPHTLRDYLENYVHDQFDLPPASLLINCSHTHCGPEIRTTRWSEDANHSDRLTLARKYVAILKTSLAAVIDSATGRLEPVSLVFCHSRCGFAMNRRTPRGSGFINFPNPEGPVDHDVPVLKFTAADGTIKGIIFGYACHNTTLGIYKFSGDYAGVAQKQLENTYADAIALFVLGCGADINPYPRGTVALAEIHGTTLATSVQAALQTTPTILNEPLDLSYEKVKLKYSPAPSKEELITRSRSSNSYESLHAERLLKQLDQQGHLLTEYNAPVQVIRFGKQLTWIALPGETCVDYSLRLKAELENHKDLGRLWVSGYSNDVFAYLPSRRVLLEGGYEGGGAMKYFTTVLQHGPFASDIEQRIIGKVNQLLQRSSQ
ncbi:MAG: hypothetical protein CMJ76_10860 [Planctomycetaceae bacterium]|nr:hypothetical protein [Planctomycetaceae bacterium]